MATLRSIGDVGIQVNDEAFGLWDAISWMNLYTAVKTWAVNSLVVALAGVGLSTDLQMVRGLGAKPFVVGLGAAVLVGVVSFVSLSLLSFSVVF